MERITHVIPSMSLALSLVKFKDGRIVSGEVVNGAWRLQRCGDDWLCKDMAGTIVHRHQARPEDDVVVVVPREKGFLDYNTLISWAAGQVSADAATNVAAPKRKQAKPG